LLYLTGKSLLKMHELKGRLTLRSQFITAQARLPQCNLTNREALVFFCAKCYSL